MNLAKAWKEFEKSLFSCLNGGAYLTLHLHGESVPQGGELIGELVLCGGRDAQRINALMVEFKELHAQGDSSEWKTLTKAIIAGAVDVGPGETQRYPFRLHVPGNARLSANAFSAQVTAEARIPWALNRRSRLYVRVTPPAEIMTVDSALQELGFRPRQFNFTAVRGSKQGMVTNAYHAPHSLQAQITGITLRLCCETEAVAGQLVLHQTRTHLKDIVRAVTGEDKQVFPLVFSRALLTDTAGIAGANLLLKKLFDQALILPDNQKNWMLRAASVPSETGAALLRPSNAEEETHPEQLLRPDK